MKLIVSEHRSGAIPPCVVSLSPSTFVFQSTSFRSRAPALSFIRSQRWRELAVIRGGGTPSSPTVFLYGGWEELEWKERSLVGIAPRSSFLGFLRRFLVFHGVGEGKHAFVFFLGFLSAAAVLRFRFSLMVLVPISVLIFAAGFAAGVAQCEPIERIVRVSDEKLADLGSFFDELDGRMNRLRIGMEEFLGTSGKTNRHHHLEAVENLRSWISDAEKAFEGSFDAVMGKNSAEKTTRGNSRDLFQDLFQFCGNLFRDDGIMAKPTSRKKFTNSVKESAGGVDGNNTNSKGGNLDEDYEEPRGLRNSTGRKERHRRSGAKDGEYGSGCCDMFSYEGNDLGSSKRSGYAMNNKQGSYRKTFFQEEYDSQSSKSSISETSSPLLDHRNGIDIREMSMEFKDPLEEGTPLEEFEELVKEASDLLKHTKECLSNDQNESKKAEAMLYRSERILSEAVSINPKSLLAVGQLGNTYLLHGELKLKASRELRALMSGDDDVAEARLRFKTIDVIRLGRVGVVSLLHNVCEEGEALLVEAGRKYRMALSIDKDDIRSLYNWGLALTFRAQLIADIGPEAACDADKVYMAAIDKFDAMMSRSNAYKTNALLRWGVVLQQRSRLQLHSSKEKMRLLRQAKTLYEDALMEQDGSGVGGGIVDKLLVREALDSCVSELSFFRARSNRVIDR